MKRFFAAGILFCMTLALIPGLEEEIPDEIPFEAPKGGLLWSASWDPAGKLKNRLDGRISWLGFNGRIQALDSRPGLFVSDAGASLSALSGGLYHQASGSRILYGVIEGKGFASRLGNTRPSQPRFADRFTASSGDLKTVASNRENELYVLLNSPRIGPFGGFIQGQSNFSPDSWAYGGGIDYTFDHHEKKPAEKLALETYLHRQKLETRSSSSWFSAVPPLPEREVKLYGLSASYVSRLITIRSEGALSATAFFGKGLWGSIVSSYTHTNAAGKKRWKADLAFDISGDCFVDRKGKIPGAGFSLAGAYEWNFYQDARKNGALEGSAYLAALLPGAEINRFGLGLSYHFPPNTISLSWDRNESKKNRAITSFNESVSFKTGLLGIKLQGKQAWTEGQGLSSLKTAAEASYEPKPFQFQLTTGQSFSRSAKGQSKNVWDASLSASFQHKVSQWCNAKGTLKVYSPSLPETWGVSIAWRMEIKL
jgi:hypothetical protein